MPRFKLTELTAELQAVADPKRSAVSVWFFKTGKGQYGEGDQFLGVSVPNQRKIAHRYIGLPVADIQKLLASRLHEHRFIALEILVTQFKKGNAAKQKEIYRFLLANTAHINNWDLVDTSVPHIVGAYLLTRPRAILRKLAKSKNIWERRMAIVATFAFIRAGQTEDTFAIAQMLLNDEHDLIHKAVGWALREAGKQQPDLLLGFLEEHYARLPRTTLRYAIERFTPTERKCFLAGNFTNI